MTIRNISDTMYSTPGKTDLEVVCRMRRSVVHILETFHCTVARSPCREVAAEPKQAEENMAFEKHRPAPGRDLEGKIQVVPSWESEVVPHRMAGSCSPKGHILQQMELPQQEEMGPQEVEPRCQSCWEAAQVHGAKGKVEEDASQTSKFQERTYQTAASESHHRENSVAVDPTRIRVGSCSWKPDDQRSTSTTGQHLDYPPRNLSPGAAAGWHHVDQGTVTVTVS